ncbi:MAG TPA: hypothetical protein VMW71_06270 [Thermoplasmata archaeon]|nr:hypothetical protein [Thermoplasmata archaeon]
MGPKEYGILLTSERSIFVLEKASKAGIGAVLGTRVKNRESAQAQPGPAPADVTFFQGQQQKPPGNV